MLHWVSSSIGRVGLFVRVTSELKAHFAYLRNVSGRVMCSSCTLHLQSSLSAVYSFVQSLELSKAGADNLSVLDGLTADTSKDTLVCGLKNLFEHLGRLLCVTSSGFREKQTDQDRMILWREFNAWSLSDLQDAWKHLKTQVWDLEKLTSEMPDDFFSQKFFFAGFSGRWFFKCDIRRIKELVASCLRGVIDSRVDLVKSFNHLMFSKWKNNNLIYCAASLYVARLLAINQEKSIMDMWEKAKQSVRFIFGTLSNPSLSGILLEHSVLHAIRINPVGDSSVLLFFVYTSLTDQSSVALTGHSVIPFALPWSDITNDPLERCMAWFLPLKFNQGGYDLVHVALPNDGDERVVCSITFFQISQAHGHSLKWRYMEEFLARLCREPVADDQMLFPDCLVPAVECNSPANDFLALHNVWPEDLPAFHKEFTSEKKSSGTGRVQEAAFQRFLEEKMQGLTLSASPSITSAAPSKRAHQEMNDALHRETVARPLRFRRRIFGRTVSAVRVKVIFLCPTVTDAHQFQITSVDKPKLSGTFGVDVAFLPSSP
jgi:hypothetical protein